MQVCIAEMEVVAESEQPPRTTRRRRTGETSSRRVRARINSSSSSTQVSDSGALVLASPASVSNEDNDNVLLSHLVPIPAELLDAPLDSQGLQVAIISPAPIDQEQIIQELLTEALPTGVTVEGVNSPELVVEASLDEVVPAEVVPTEAAATEAIPAERPASDTGKAAMREPGDCSGIVGKSLLLDASALHDYELAEEAFKGMLYLADAEELLRKPLRLLRRDIVENVIRTSHYLNHLCEHSLNWEKEARRWESEAIALQGSRKNAIMAMNELREENDALQKEVAAGVKAVRDSRVEVVTFEAKLAAQTARIEELEAKCAAAEERANSAVTDFRASEEFKNERLKFASRVYEAGVEETQRRVMASYPNINWALVFASAVVKKSSDPSGSDPPAS